MHEIVPLRAKFGIIYNCSKSLIVQNVFIRYLFREVVLLLIGNSYKWCQKTGGFSLSLLT